MNPMIRSFFAVLAMLFCTQLVAANTVPEIRDLFSHPKFGSARLSPDGRYLAVVTPFEDEDRLIVLERKTNKPLSGFSFGSGTGIGFFAWANDERLLVSPVKKLGALETPRSTGELYAGNADGSKKIQLLGPQMKGENLSYGFHINSMNIDDSDNIIVTKGDSASYPTAYHLNIYTADVRKSVRSPVRGGDLLFDRNDVARVASGVTSENVSVIMYRASKDEDWKEIHKAPYGEETLNPVFVEKDSDWIWALSDIGHKTIGVVRFNGKTQALEPVFHDPDADVDTVIFSRDRKQVIGAIVGAGYPQHVFFDEKHQDSLLYRNIEKLFPGRFVRFGTFSKDMRFTTVQATGDKDPGSAFLLDSEKLQLTPLFQAMPWLEGKTFAEREAFKIQARDGLPLWGYLTLPSGKEENLPTIIIVHGGPHGVRDYWSFDPEAQLFASRGYAVLQVNFRGSGGYGREFARAGYQRWGTDMQHDLIDTVQWAINEGITDAKRICIYGASYGGYAALMNPIVAPDLYQCAIGFVGVYDLELLYGKGDVPARSEGVAYLNKVIGEDKTQLQTQSPLYQLDRLKIPVMVAHGEKDIRAHFRHYELLVAELKKRNHPHETLTKAGEGHGFYNVDNRVDLYTHMLEFIEKHIGK